jgi:hypothetical protein
MNRKGSGAADFSRLRAGEIASGVGGVLLLGWSARRRVPVLRWLSLAAGASGLVLTYTQATRRAPALPVAVSVIVTVLGGATTVGLLSRVLTRRAQLSAGNYFGLVAAVTTAGGGFASMRQESGTDPAELGELETITL